MVVRKSSDFLVALRRVSVSIQLVVLVAGLLPASGGDWPQYRHDAARSGVTDEGIRTPLVQQWKLRPNAAPSPAWEDPKPVPVEGYLELPRMKFDDAYHVAVVGDALYFGSSGDYKIYCLDANTGKERWSFITGGPVRFTPQIWEGRLYAVSDDGYMYCLQASDGKELWRFGLPPRPDKVLGNGEMVSMWPPRTGVLVDNGIAYASAGIFPAEGVHLHAVNAANGKKIWQSESGGRVFQGYLLASPTTLFAPQGRLSPCGIDRKTGRVTISQPYFGKGTGGSWALLVDNEVVSGSEQIMAYGQNVRGTFAWFPGRKIVVTPNMSYMVSESEMWAIDRKAYGQASLQYRSAKLQRQRVDLAHRRLVATIKRQQAPLNAGIKRDVQKLDGLKKQLLALVKAKQTQGAQYAALKTQADALATTLDVRSKQIEQQNQQIAQSAAQLKTMLESEKAKRATMDAALKWRVPADTSESMIYAPGVIFAGGVKKVVAVDTGTGKTLWTGQVDGKARGLAIANGHLFVSTNSGAIYCFGPTGSPQLGTVAQARPRVPFARDSQSAVFEAAAKAILKETGKTEGYCLVYGSGTGRLAYELAKRTNLIIYGVDPDREKVQAARRALVAAGLYGTRVSFDVEPLEKVPYADYFADLIVSETALVTGKVPGSAKEMYRMLRPLGGAAYLGQPAAAGRMESLSASAFQDWLKNAGIQSARIEQRDKWLKIVRGKLPGAADWTHEYANAANTACSLDDLVKTPLGILWFGAPGPTDIPNRHQSATAPLCVNGILFIQGDNVLMGYDAYNGRKLWKRHLAGAMRTGLKQNSANIAASQGSFFVAIGSECLRIDPATGKTTAKYPAPLTAGGKKQRWGYLACVGDLIFGSTEIRRSYSNRVFAINHRTGKLAWQYKGKGIRNMVIAVSNSAVFFVDTGPTKEEKKQAIHERFAQFDGLKGEELLKAEQELTKPDVRKVVALDSATGSLLWERPIEVSNCVRISSGGGDLAVMIKDNILLLCGQPWNGHFWQEFFSGAFKRRSLIALSASDGHLLWSSKAGYRSRPLIVGDTIIAEPWGYDLKTGKPKMRINPITGKKERWQMSRPGHHCGPIAASAHTLAFRSGVFAFHDLTGDGGTTHFDGQRTGCHINFISADGLLLVPEGSSGCMCPFPNHCTVVFKHRELNRSWTRYSVEGATLPVKDYAIDFGAPGDRRAKSGKMWLSYPRPGAGRLILAFKVDLAGYPGGGFFRHQEDTVKFAGTDISWLYASGYEGIRGMAMKLVGTGDGEAQYTVRLHFADLEKNPPGQRVFSIKIQGKTVLRDFDIVREAGGSNRAIIKEFKGIRVEDKLHISFVSKLPAPPRNRSPLIQGIEIAREKVLNPDFTVPQFLINNARPEQSQPVRLANYMDADFSGTLRAKAPAGFTISPASQDIFLKSATTATVELQAALAGRAKPGTYPIDLELLSKDGTVLSRHQAKLEYLGDRDRVVLKAIEDAYVGHAFSKRNLGNAKILLVDGGNSMMGDESHNITYVKFKLDIPGKPVSATFRIYNASNPTSNGGNVNLVEEPWEEMKITYDNRPKPGQLLGNIGRVNPRDVLEVPIAISLEGRKELSLVIDPVNNDGVDYIPREGGKPPELLVEYQAVPRPGPVEKK